MSCSPWIKCQYFVGGPEFSSCDLQRVFILVYSPLVREEAGVREGSEEADSPAGRLVPENGAHGSQCVTFL